MSKLEHRWNFVLPRIRSDLQSAGQADLLHRSGVKILEYGSGNGDTAFRFALDHPEAHLVGADIRNADPGLPEKAAAIIGRTARPENLTYVNMARPPEDADTLIARPSDIDMGRIPDLQYDICYSWCVFEHIDTQIVASTLARLHGLIRPGGLLYVMINPLYFSEYGSHLNGILPEPWLHLALDVASLRERFYAAEGSKAGRRFMWEQFETLNRLTANHLRMLIEQAGFEILWEDRKVSGKPSAGLLATYDADVLRTKEIALVGRR